MLSRLTIIAVLDMIMFASIMEGVVPLVGNFRRYPLGLSDFGVIVVFSSILLSTFGLLYFTFIKSLKKGNLSAAKSYLLIAMLVIIAFILLMPPFLGITFPP